MRLYENFCSIIKMDLKVFFASICLFSMIGSYCATRFKQYELQTVPTDVIDGSLIQRNAASAKSCVYLCATLGVYACNTAHFSDTCDLMMTSCDASVSVTSGTFWKIKPFVQTCDPGWTFNCGSCYQVYTTPLNWSDAKSSCEALGAHLATITGSSETKFLEKMMSVGKHPSVHYWIGGSDAEEEARWEWVTGEVATYRNFGVNQPNAGGDANCLTFISPLIVWNDVKCEAALNYVCEKELN
ncbi:perlucin-like [Mya arenaria]|uniref:perlucin-like n=1 Tax=Mya arenaria TaxID=6604 RepID=UPI0022E81EC5|nr:perlucin-like [Mya arenaria]